VHAAFGIGLDAIGVGEDDAARPEGGRDDAAANDAVADGAGGLIATAAHHRNTGHQATGPGGLLRQNARDFGRLVDRRQQGRIDVEQAQEFLGPAAALDVQQERARGVADFGGKLAGQAVADVVLRQENLRGALINARLVSADPEDLRRREAREGRVRDHAEETAPTAGRPGDLVALGAGPLIVPEDRAAKDPAAPVEEDGAVHLARQADAGDLDGPDLGRTKHLANTRPGRLPPILGVLLAPGGPGSVRGILDGGRRADAAALVHQEGLRAAGTDVDAEQIGHEGLRSRRPVPSAAAVPRRPNRPIKPTAPVREPSFCEPTGRSRPRKPFRPPDRG